MRTHVPPILCHPHSTQSCAATTATPTWTPASPAAAASTCHRCHRPVRPTANPVLPPSTLRDHASHTRAACVSGPTTAYPHTPALRQPPTAYRLSPCSDPTYGTSTSHTDIQARTTTHPKLTHASHLSRSHPWGLAPIKRLAAPPHILLPHYASCPATTRLVQPLLVSSRQYACRPPTTRVATPTTTHAGPQPCVWLPHRPPPRIPHCCTPFSGPFRASRPSASAGYSPISGEYVAIEVHSREPVQQCVLHEGWGEQRGGTQGQR